MENLHNVGDLNNDCDFNVLDILQMVDFIIFTIPTESDISIGDINQDGELNIVDVIILVNIILSE